MKCYELQRNIEKEKDKSMYWKAVSINMSRLEARFRFYRLIMKAKFDVYLVWPFKEKLIP